MPCVVILIPKHSFCNTVCVCMVMQIKLVLLLLLLIRRFQLDQCSLKTPRIVSHTGYLPRGVRSESVTKSLLARDLNLDILCKKPFQSKNFTFIWRGVFSLIGCRYAFQSLRSLIVWGLISSRWSQKALWMEELKIKKFCT